MFCKQNAPLLQQIGAHLGAFAVPAFLLECNSAGACHQSVNKVKPIAQADSGCNALRFQADCKQNVRHRDCCTYMLQCEHICTHNACIVCFPVYHLHLRLCLQLGCCTRSPFSMCCLPLADCCRMFSQVDLHLFYLAHSHASLSFLLLLHSLYLHWMCQIESSEAALFLCHQRATQIGCNANPHAMHKQNVMQSSSQCITGALQHRMHCTNSMLCKPECHAQPGCNAKPGL